MYDRSNSTFVDKTTDFATLINPRFLKVIERSLKEDTETDRTKNDSLQRFFDLYTIKLKLKNSLCDFFIECKLVDMGQVLSAIFIIDVSLVLYIVVRMYHSYSKVQNVS